MMNKIILLAIFLSTSAYSKICDFLPFYNIQKTTSRVPSSADFLAGEASVTKQCIKSLAFDAYSPLFPKKLFKKLDGEEVLLLHWPVVDGFDSYLFITDSEYKALHLPKYVTSTINLPGDIAHFKSGAKDFYLSQELGGEVLVFSAPQIAARAADLMTSIASVTKKTKQYEDYLKSKNLLSSLSITTDPEIVESVLPILKYHVRQTVFSYLTGKYDKVIPDYNTIVGHHNQFQGLSEVDRVKYRRSFDDIKAGIIKDIHVTYPVCQEVISEEVISSFFEEFWGSRKRIHDIIHNRFYPEN